MIPMHADTYAKYFLILCRSFVIIRPVQDVVMRLRLDIHLCPGFHGRRIQLKKIKHYSFNVADRISSIHDFFIFRSLARRRLPFNNTTGQAERNFRQSFFGIENTSSLTEFLIALIRIVVEIIIHALNHEILGNLSPSHVPHLTCMVSWVEPFTNLDGINGTQC